MRKFAIVAALTVSIALLVGVAFLLHPFGYPPSQMDDYIIENAQQETGANNAATMANFHNPY